MYTIISNTDVQFNNSAFEESNTDIDEIEHDLFIVRVGLE